MQYKRVLLVDQEEGASVGESTRLAPAQLLTAQEAGIGTQLWKKIKYEWTLDCDFYRMLHNQGASMQ